MIRAIATGLYAFGEGVVGICCDVLDHVLPGGLYADPVPPPMPWTDGTD